MDFSKMTDVESRNWLESKTRNGHWDEVIGVSQKAINDTFVQLFNIHPEMSNMYSDDPDIGRIEAKLLPPNIIIPGGNSVSDRSRVYFLLRFESGSMANSTGHLDIDDLSGWILSTPVIIENRPKDLDPAKYSKKQIAANAAQYEAVKAGFDRAGDYSIERLYAKLSSAVWSTIDEDHSSAGKDDSGKPISMSSWADDNPRQWELLRLWVEDWSREQDQKGRSLIGVSLQVPTGPNPSTYEPTSLLYQTYPYISAKQNCPDGAEGLDSPGNRNSLLYCEMVKQNPQPGDGELIWSGNFATQATTPDGTDQIDGTFLLSRDVFLETFLLPQFQILNQATEVHFSDPSGEQNGDVVRCWTPYNVGYDPNHPSFTDDVYKFKTVNPDNDPQKPNGYLCNKVDQTKEIYFENGNQSQGSLKASVRSELNVHVDWAPGSPTLKITGHCTVQENLIWDHGVPHNFNDLWAWVKDNYTVDWSLEVTISTATGENDNGVLDVQIKQTPPTVGWNKDQVQIVDDGHRDDINNQLISRFNEVIPTLENNIREQLRGSGRFMYPGNGVFGFEESLFTYWGDLVAKIKYLPLDPKNLIILPTGAKIREHTAPPTLMVRKPLDVNPGKFVLEWSQKPTVVAAATTGNITLTGVNSTSSTVTISDVRIDFTSKKATNNLFYEDSFALADPPTSDKDKHDTKITNGDSHGDAPSGGVVSLVQKTAGKNVTIKLMKILEKASGDKWEITLTGSSGKLVLNPGESVAVTMEGKVNVAGTYAIKVDEGWTDTQHFGNDFNIKVA